MEKLHLDEKGSPYYIQNRIKNTDEKSLKMLYRAIDLIKEGNTKLQLTNVLIGEGFAKSLIDKFLVVAYSVISAEYLRSEVGVFNLHFERYNQDVQKLFEKEFSGVDWIKNQSNAYMQILLTLEAKEKLLGFHRPNFHVILNQRNTVIVKEEKSKFDITKLTWEEKLELIKLFELTRREEDFAIVAEPVVQVDEEYTKVEVIEEVNIDKIKHKVQTIPEPVKTYTGLTDAFEKMKKTFEEVAKQKLRDAGSKTV